MELLFVCLAAHDSEFRRWPDGVDRRICQTFAASPAEPGELPLGFRYRSGKALRMAVRRSKHGSVSEDAIVKRPLLVVDGDSFAHRAYHALPKTILRPAGKP